MADAGQQCQGEAEAQGHRGEHRRGAQQVEESAQGRTDDAGGLPGQGVPGDGAAQVPGRYQVRHDRLAGRIGEGPAGPEHQQQDIDRPDLANPTQGTQHQAGRHQRGHGIAGQQDRSTVETVRDVAGDERQDHRRQEDGQTHQPQGEGVVGQVVHPPADGDALDLSGHSRDEAGTPVSGEVGRPKGLGTWETDGHGVSGIVINPRANAGPQCATIS